MSRIVKNHSSQVLNLEKILARFKMEPEFLTITPGRIKKTAGHRNLEVRIQYSLNPEGTSWKLLVQSGKAIQELFLITAPLRESELQFLIEHATRKLK